MPSEESILLTHIQNAIGKLSNLPDPSSRSTVLAKLKELLLRIGNVPILQILQGSNASSETLTLEPTDLSPFGLCADGTNLYVGTGVGQIAQPGQIIQIDLATFARVTSINLAVGENQVRYLAEDPRYLYAAVINSVVGGLPGSIVRIDKLNGMGLQRVDAILLPDMAAPVEMAIDGTFLYVCGGIPIPARIIKIDISVDLSTGQQRFVRVTDFPIVTTGLENIAIDGSFLYVNTSDSPGQIHKIDIATFTEVLPFITLPTDSEGLYVDGNIMFVGGFTVPVSLMRVDLDSFSFIDSITFTAGSLASPGLFSDGSIIYMTDFSDPTHLFKADISTFKPLTVETLSGATAGQLTLDQRFIYVCTRTTPGSVIRRFIYPTTNAIDRHIAHIHDQTATGFSFLAPTGTTGTVLTSGAGAFVNGIYSDIIPAGTVINEFFLYAIFLDKTTITTQFEVDIAIGTAGSEQVIATVSHEVFNTNDSREYQIQPPIDIPSNTRISARCRDETGGGTVNIKVRYKINAFI